jgi:hypothetical protein
MRNIEVARCDSNTVAAAPNCAAQPLNVLLVNRLHPLGLNALVAQPLRHGGTGTTRPAPYILWLEQLVLQQFWAEANLSSCHSMVSNNDLVHALKIIDANQIQLLYSQVGFLQLHAQCLLAAIHQLP